MKTTNILLLIVLSSIFTIHRAGAQIWTQTSATNNSWQAVASSADGTKLAAVVLNGGIYTSTNSGASWTQTKAPDKAWWSIASSADGTQLAAVVDGGKIYVSTNSGLDWVSNGISAYWDSVTESADGSKLAAGAFEAAGNPTNIFLSTDSGMTWTPATHSPVKNWYAVASSADGTKLFAAGADISINTLRQIYVSTNSGTDWTVASAPSNQWETIASSADGTKVIAAVYGGDIFTSADGGNTWQSNSVPDDPLHVLDWLSVAASADGSRLAAACSVPGGYPAAPIYTSTNAGDSWISNSVPGDSFNSIASSADGDQLIAANDGGIWISRMEPSPTINAVKINADLALSWIVPSTNFVLQQNFDLSTTNWMDVTNVPVLNLTNLQDEVTLPVSDSNDFFRLRTP